MTDGATTGTALPRSSRIEVWIPPVLLVVAWVVGAVAARSWLPADHVAWALLPSALLLVLRGALEARLRVRGPGERVLEALYGLHLVLLAVATALNPLTCIYTFTGYIDSSRFLTGARARAVVVATALLCAVGQVGGLPTVRSQPWFFVGLAAVNLLIALGMMHLAEEREQILERQRRALAENARMQAENERLQEQLVAGARRAGADEERARLSREIHDTVAQGLVGVIRQLEAVGAGIGAEEGERVRRAEDAARDCLVEARRAVDALSPHQLDGAGTREALGGIVARWARTHRVVATFDADDAPEEVVHGPVMLRIAQEALANVARHAGAGTVAVVLAGTEDGQVLRVHDDGRGFSPQGTAAGHGLQNRRERLREVGGTLTVDSAPGEGCTISAEVPR